MDDKLLTALESLTSSDWSIRRKPRPTKLPTIIQDRYPWLPSHFIDFVSAIELAVTADSKAWFLSTADYEASSESAYAWNQWEIDSLIAAKGDAGWAAEIVAFWDAYFPILLSVKSGYAYFAIRQQDLKIVVGEEPEFEEVTVLASSFVELMHLIVESNQLGRWL